VTANEGRSFHYRCRVNDLDISRRPCRAGWIEGAVTLSWELLILRFPQFLIHRRSPAGPTASSRSSV
jgi:hypothetical protein